MISLAFHSKYCELHLLVILNLLAIFLLISAVHFARSFVQWRVHFGKERRLSRSRRGCPSHKEAPLQSTKRKRGSPRRQSSFSPEVADRLDMDHIYLPFRLFLWGMIFIFPATFFTGVWGILSLMLKYRLRRWGVIRSAPFDHARVCYDLCLHGTLAIYFVGFGEDEIAKYRIENFPIINEDGRCEIKELLELRVDFKSKRLISAAFDRGDSLTSSEALIVLWFYNVSAHHVKMHSLANWGVQVESIPSMPGGSNFISRNGTATVMYNYFGYSGFVDFIPMFQTLGLLSPNFDPSALKEVFDSGIGSGVAEHSSVAQLAKYSTFVDFIVKVRRIFIVEFIKHKDHFPVCDIEALFAGTVLHSLDHTMAGWNLREPLWLDASCPKYGRMAELGRIVRAGFVDDLSGLAFHKSFRRSGHPFYEAVYKKASKINKLYADKMDTCIIK